MMIETVALEGLDRHVRNLVDAESAPEVFRALLEGMALATPTAAIFLVRQGQIKGWNSFGLPRDVAVRQRAVAIPAPGGWLSDPDGATSPEIDFGQPEADAVHNGTLSVKGRPIALLVASKTHASAPWHPELINVLLAVAQLRLAYTLLKKRADRTPAPAGEAPSPAASPETTSVTPAEPAPSAAVVPTPDLSIAERFARLVATDIRLYNEDGVMAGRREGDLESRLGEEMTRGKEVYVKRHGALGEPAMRFLREAYVQVLAGGDASLIPDSLFD
jgi:hypothetical protein